MIQFFSNDAFSNYIWWNPSTTATLGTITSAAVERWPLVEARLHVVNSFSFCTSQSNLVLVLSAVNQFCCFKPCKPGIRQIQVSVNVSPVTES